MHVHQNMKLTEEVREKGTHTANNIYRTYEETTEVYNMADNVSGIVTDNAANMVKTFTIFPPWDVQDSDKDQDEADIEVASVRDKLDYFSPKRSPCFVHMLQLVVCDALEQAGPLRQVMAKTAQPFVTSLAQLNHASPCPAGNTSARSYFLNTTDQLRSQIDLWSSRDMRGTHTANNIYRTYEETTEVYNMADNVSGIVTDNAANMVKTFTIFPPWDVQDSDKDQDEADIEVASVRDKLDYFSPKRSPCFVHMLQLVVCDALEQAGPLRQVMAKVCRIVSYCHKYTKATE
ncbi:UNVERIFIED_CONTAM: hypothetical protein FKN15_049092 [Acipenser sinensis]